MLQASTKGSAEIHRGLAARSLFLQQAELSLAGLAKAEPSGFEGSLKGSKGQQGLLQANYAESVPHVSLFPIQDLGHI